MNFIKGFVVGIGKIIPGVSGAMLAMAMGIYDKSIEYICNFMKNKKEATLYLVPIGLGVVFSIIFFSRIISFCLDNFYIITMLFFVGLIIGGVPMVVSKVKKKHYFISVISFVFFFLISISGINNVYVIKGGFGDIFIFFISGILEAIGTVVPGISSTALLMVLGTYNSVLSAIGSLNNFNVLIPFGIGFIVGLILVVKIINYLFKRCEDVVYAFVLGVLISSVILLIILSFKYSFSITQFIIGLVFMVIGIVISNLLKEK